MGHLAQRFSPYYLPLPPHYYFLRRYYRLRSEKNETIFFLGGTVCDLDKSTQTKIKHRAFRNQNVECYDSLSRMAPDTQVEEGTQVLPDTGPARRLMRIYLDQKTPTASHFFSQFLANPPTLIIE